MRIEYRKRGICLDCGRTELINGRGLGGTCYARHRKAGTLEQFPPTVNHDDGEGAPLDGISYRQLDYWVRRGYLKPEYLAPGSGAKRRWTAEERRVAQTMARLVAAGFTPEAAHPIARNGPGQLYLGHGVSVEVA